ncbi:hypothetical protein [Coxiella endosymbiont of Amblyomma americanum]|uniref:hypothetical protein n=1 Tax=Coxiella endosymbiont of Amblyomma americanum TaxID=325775 RepID=UPI000ABB0309|nr:hypothetical protein [Coxiella endosymbiont of Amblyomma americanum]
MKQKDGILERNRQVQSLDHNLARIINTSFNVQKKYSVFSLKEIVIKSSLLPVMII